MPESYADVSDYIPFAIALSRPYNGQGAKLRARRELDEKDREGIAFFRSGNLAIADRLRVLVVVELRDEI